MHQTKRNNNRHKQTKTLAKKIQWPKKGKMKWSCGYLINTDNCKLVADQQIFVNKKDRNRPTENGNNQSCEQHITHMDSRETTVSTFTAYHLL